MVRTVGRAGFMGSIASRLSLHVIVLCLAGGSRSSSGLEDDPDDLLQPTFEWNAGLPPDARYVTPVEGSTSRNIAVQGALSIRKWENPKQLAAVRSGARPWRWNADPLDVLVLHQNDEYGQSSHRATLDPAIATVKVHLGEAHVGLNNFRLFARTDARYAAALTPTCPLVRAVLAPLAQTGNARARVCPGWGGLSCGAH